MQGEIIYAAPPPSPRFWPEGILKGGGGVCFEAPRGTDFIPPLFYTPPPPLEGFFQRCGGCIKFGPVTKVGPVQCLLLQCYCRLIILEWIIRRCEEPMSGSGPGMPFKRRPKSTHALVEGGFPWASFEQRNHWERHKSAGRQVKFQSSSRKL